MRIWSSLYVLKQPHYLNFKEHLDDDRNYPEYFKLRKFY